MTSSTGRTVGVEEEYHFVDAETLRVADVPGAVTTAQALLGEQAQSEISTSQLEAVTPPCATLAELRAELVRLRAAAVQVAEHHGARLVCAGTPPLGSWLDQRLTPGHRYALLAERWRLVARQQLIAGCHVHVHVDDPDLAIAVLDRLRPDLPTLLALSTSSPFWDGVDTGYASYRTPWYQRWAVTGPNDLLGTRQEYDRLVATLVETGEIDDASHLYWDARMSVRFPTVEVRVADAMPHVDDVVLQAALTRALVRAAADAAVRGEPFPQPRPEVVRAARWRAARDGLEGELFDLHTARLAPAHDVVRRLLARVREHLAAAGEWDEVSDVAERALRRGTSAAQQRAALARRGEMRDVVTMLAEQTSGN